MKEEKSDKYKKQLKQDIIELRLKSYNNNVMNTIKNGAYNKALLDVLEILER